MDPSRRDYLVLMVTGIMTMLLVGISSPIIPLYAQEFTTSFVLIGLTVSGYFAVRMFFEMPFGTLSDRMGPRKPLILGRVLAMGGVVLSYFATDALHLVLARALWGIGDAAFFCIATAYIASSFPARERGKALGVFISIETIGSFVGQSFGGFAASALSYRGVFLISIPLSVATLPLLFLFRGTIETTRVRVERKQAQGLKQIMTLTLIGASIINFTVIFITNGITSTILPLYLTNLLRIPLPQYGLLVAINTVGSIIGNFSGGWLSDRIGRLRIILVGIAFLGLSSYLFAIFTTLIPLTMAMILQGFAWGSVYSVTPVLVVDAVPSQLRGLAVGMYRTFFDLGGLIGPIFMSALAGSSGFIPSFYVGAFISLSNIILILFLGKKPKRNLQITEHS
jgi:MFS family permease